MLREPKMQIRELSKPITAAMLNESLASKFGYKINLEQFSNNQLEDARNKLRTKLSQFELEESFDSMHTSPDYQKTKMFLDVINQAILEREMTGQDKAKEKKLKAKYDDSGMKKNMQKQYGKTEGKNVYFATIRKKAMDHSVPESWIDSAISRMELGETDESELQAELTTRYDLSESTANYIFYLSEAEQDKAHNIMSTKDMVEQVTRWLDDVAQMKAEQFLELIDSIGENQGSDVAQQYQAVVKPALEQIYAALETARQGLNKGLSIVSGKQPETMGAGAEVPAVEPVPGEEPAMCAEPGMDLGAEPDMGTPPAPEAGREKRESVDYSRRLGILLAASKKK